MVLVIIANLLALVRSGVVLNSLGFRSNWRDLFLAFSAGNVSNLPLNVVGQSLTRAMVLGRAGIPFGITVMATYVERLLAAGLLFLFSLFGLWFLLGTIAFDVDQGGGAILVKVAGIAIVGAVAGLTVFRTDIVGSAAACAHWLFKLWPSAILTILIHGAGLAAYLVLLMEFDLLSVSTSLVAALAIVMFVTSLPISFAGWGLRELSAASTLGLIGVSSEVAVASAIAIGLLFLAATGLFGSLGLLMLAGKRHQARNVQKVGYTDTEIAKRVASNDWDAKIVWGCAFLCAVLIFFRVPTQLASSAFPINVNVADIVIFVALSVITMMIAAGRMRSLFPSFLNTALAGLTVVIGVGLLVSVARGNLGGWALYMKGVGWILMLGYVALGAAVVGVAGEKGRLQIAKSLIVAAMTVCALQLLVLAWSTTLTAVPSFVLAYPLRGFANNQNAFSFELATIGVLLIVACRHALFDDRPWMFTAAIAVLTMAIYLTGSRTGAVFIVVLAIFDHVLSRTWAGHESPPGPRVTTIAAIAIVAAILLPYVAYLGAAGLQSALGIEIDADRLFALLARPDETGGTRLLHPSADIERWETIVGGLRLWADSPVWGAGLGAYVESVLASGAPAQGIHSVYIWFLAEMGLLGLCAVVALAALVAIRAWRMTSVPPARPWGFTILGVFSLMAIGGLVQDFFYQRIFWFVLGLASAAGPERVRGASDPRVFMTVVIAFGVAVFFLAL